MTRNDHLPDVTRSDSALVLTSQLSVDDPAHQRAAADALIDVFERVPWPEGLLSHTVMLGTDGTSLQHYAQWTSTDAYEAFSRHDPPERLEYIRAIAPDLKRELSGSYMLYRSMPSTTAAVPDCIVIISVEFEGSDEQGQRDWVDAVFDALEGETQLPPGGLSAHFHLSTDGKRVLNYAEWLDEAAHVAAMQRAGNDSIGNGPLWERVQSFPGLKSSQVERFTPYRSMDSAIRSAGQGSGAVEAS